MLVQQKTFQTVVVGQSLNSSYPTFLIYVLHRKMLGLWVWVEGCSLHVCDLPCSHGPLLSVTVSTIPVESLYRGRQVMQLTRRCYLMGRGGEECRLINTHQTGNTFHFPMFIHSVFAYFFTFAPNFLSLLFQIQWQL